MFSSQNSQVSSDANYIEDVFSTYLYTGTGASQTITNGIDLAGEGGLVWIKSRNVGFNHILADTARGSPFILHSNSTDESRNGTSVGYGYVSAFNNNGFTVTPGPSGPQWVSNSGSTYSSWTFRKQPKFFDVVTYTGNGATQNIAHNLGATVGSIFIKQTNAAGEDWAVYHRGLPLVVGSLNDNFLSLNTTNASASSTDIWNRTVPTSTVFSVGNHPSTNTNGATYVAYLFAHDAGGFGLTGTDNVISCGSYTGTGSAGNAQTLGYEPQWMIVKKSSSSTVGDWFMVDTMRGFSMTNDSPLYANQSAAEDSGAEIDPTATGFQFPTGSNLNASGATYIYIAIRRGPMKVPTTGTSVFSPINVNNSTGTQNTTNFPVDLQIARNKANGEDTFFYDRLRGVNTTDVTDASPFLTSVSTAAEASALNRTRNWGNTGYFTPANFNDVNAIYWNFRRAPSFFDEVCYTGGTGTPRVLNHNLATPPELVITRVRNFSGEDWIVHYNNGSSIIGGVLNSTSAFANSSTAPSTDITSLTSTTYTLNTSNRRVNGAYNYVAYLFATCAGVSKVGSYTGIGTTLQVNCGFTAGARFVLIKRTDSTGDWYVWDTARGIVSGNDPYLLLNSTAAEVTSTDYIDTYSAGFEISSTAPAAINASGGTFIFLAIA